MQEAKILITGKVVVSTDMSDFLYTKFGSIQGFKYKGNIYRYCVNKVAPGYYNFNDYLDFIASPSKKIPATLVPYAFIKANEGDIIKIYQRQISADFLSVCWYTYTFPYLTSMSFAEYEQIVPPDNKVLIGDSSACVHEWEAAKEFYDHFISKAIAANDRDFAELLADIQQVIESIEENIFSVLDANPTFQPFIVNQRNLWSDSVTYNYESEQAYEIKEAYAKLYSKFSLFLLYFQAYRKKLGDDVVLIFIYLAAIMSPVALKELLTDIKIKMLVRLSMRGLDNWQLFYNPQDDESVVVTILNSITPAQSDEILAAMIDTEKYNSFGMSLFQIFYSGLDNEKFGIGKDNLKNFVLSMYVIWTQSSYNPYQNGTFNSTNFGKYKYNRLVATNPDPDNDIYDLLGVADEELNYNAVPITLNYTSSKFLGIYFDNFKFYFSDEIQGAKNDGSDFDYDMRFFSNSRDAPKNKILAVQNNYVKSTSDGLYGTYDYYQPVSLVDSNQEAIMQIPVIDGNATATIESHPEKINSLIPIFLLKYIDDAGDENDFYTSLGYFVDVVSIFGGEVLLLEKLRYLRALSGFTEAIIAGSELGESTIVSLYVSATANAINLTSATVSFLLKLTGDSYKNKPWYKTLSKTMAWVEILSGAGSVLADTFLKKSARNLVAEFDALPSWPEEFSMDSRGAEAKQTLKDIADIPVSVVDPLYSKFKNSVNDKIGSLLLKENIKLFPREISKGVPLHTEADLDKIISYAFNNGMTEDETAELIHISYKANKRIDSDQLYLQVKYYNEVVKVKGYPSGFSSKEQFAEFCNKLELFWQQTFSDLSTTYQVNLDGLKYELKIQGSALRKRVPTDPVPDGVSLSKFDGLDAPRDIEFVILVDDKNFDLFINAVAQIADSSNLTELSNACSNAVKSGNFLSSKFEYFEQPILSQMRSAVKGYSSYKKVNFSVTRVNARLDLGPYITFIK